MLSTETQEAGSSVLERHASSWSGGSAERSVSRERAGPGFLLRTTPDGPANRAESAKESSHVARYYIDTQAMVKTLEEGGYSRQQAECLVSFLSTTLTANLEPLVTSQVSRKDIELLEVQVAGEVDSLRSNLLLLERSTIDTLRNENEALAAQIKKLHEILKVHVLVMLFYYIDRHQSVYRSTI
jgi:hypothetical protein